MSALSPARMVRANAYLPFIGFMEGIGAPVERELEKALVPALARENPETLVPVHLAHAFLERCARSVGLTDFGYVVGQRATVHGLGAFGRNVRRSLTLHDALGKVRTNFAFYSSAGHVWSKRVGPNIEIYHRHIGDTGVGSQYSQQCALLLLRDLVRLAAGASWQPEEVLSSNPLRDGGIMQRAFDGARVTQSEAAGFVFSAQYLAQPLRSIRGEDVRIDSEPFAPSMPASDFAGSIKQVTSVLMAHGRCQLSDVAEAVGMHPRSLQRRLSETEREYSEILAEARFEAALRLMSDPRNRVIDIALELGYTDPANFTRAFRGWTGLGPSEFRHALATRN